MDEKSFNKATEAACNVNKSFFQAASLIIILLSDEKISEKHLILHETAAGSTSYGKQTVASNSNTTH